MILLLVRPVPQAWRLMASRQRRSEALGRQSQLRWVLARWQEHVLLEVQLRHVSHLQRQRLLAAALAGWQQWHTHQRQQAAAAAAFSAAAGWVQRLRWLQGWKLAVQQARGERHMQRQRAHAVLEHWHAAASRSARQKRVAEAHAATRCTQLVARCLSGWLQHSLKQQRLRAAQRLEQMQVRWPSWCSKCWMCALICFCTA